MAARKWAIDRLFSIGFQKSNFAALSVRDILQYYLRPAALRNEFSESLYYPDIGNKHEINSRSSIKNAVLCKGGLSTHNSGAERCCQYVFRCHLSGAVVIIVNGMRL